MSESTTTPTGPTAAEVADRLHPVLDRLAAVVAGSESADGGAPTPCTEYSVADLRDHAVRWLSTFAAGYADAEGKAPDPSGIEVEDPAPQVSAAANRLLAAVADGAAERPLDLGGGQAMPGDMALSMILWEYQVHGWDLARATGQGWDPDPAGLALSLAFAPGMLTPDFQGEGKAFGPQVPVPDDAPALDRLVALSGRDPAWTP